MTVRLIDVEEWCCECSGAIADKVLIDDDGMILGFYCDACGATAMEQIKERRKPRARCHFNENSNRQCLLDLNHTGNHNLPCVESSAHGPHAKGGCAADGTLYQCSGHRFDRT